MELTDIIKEENLVLQKSKLLTDNVMHYCPGCTHGVVHKLIAGGDRRAEHPGSDHRCFSGRM